jgi:hypothetical protein
MIPISPPIYNASPHFWAKHMGQIVMLLVHRVVTLMTKYLGVTNRNHVVYNDSMCDNVRLNVAYEYECLPM